MADADDDKRSIAIAVVNGFSPVPALDLIQLIDRVRLQNACRRLFAIFDDYLLSDIVHGCRIDIGSKV